MSLYITGNPVQGGTLTILAGCDYKAADGNAAIFTNVAGTWPNLTGATPYLVGFRGNQPIPQVISPLVISPTVAAGFPSALLGPTAGTVTTPTGANQAVSFDLAYTQTAITPCASPTDLYSFAVYAQLSDGNLVPLQTGDLMVKGVGS